MTQQDQSEGQARVLVIDDSLTVATDLEGLFEQAGYQVTISATVEDARNQLANQKFKLVVLDILLPDGDGIDFLKEIKQNSLTSQIPVMILSSESEVRDRIRGLSGGAVEYIGKPYDRSYVIGRATELLKDHSIKPSKHQKSVLVIDDSVTTQTMLENLLRNAGFTPFIAQSGEEGIKLASRVRPDIFIIDAKLPGIDGPTVVNRIRSDLALRDTPCVILTESQDSNDESAALEAGSDTYIHKNEDKDVIIARLNALLRPSPNVPSLRHGGTYLSPKRILAIDDSHTYLTSIEEPLRDDGYDVISVSSGEEALNLLEAQGVDCILLDLTMPGLSGQETCKRIKSAGPKKQIPIIMLTGREDREAMLESFNAGADDYIPKSNEFVVLKARVRAQLRRKQFEEENHRIREELAKKEIEAVEAKASQELAKQRGELLTKLEFVNKELEAFTYSVSHDLRAPIRRIQGFCDILLEEYEKQLDAKGQDYLQRITSGCKSMMNLVEDLIKLSRINQGELRTEKVNITTLCKEILEKLSSSDPERKVELVIPEGLTAEGDLGLVTVVLENLLGNAWKYSSKNPNAKIEVGKTVFDSQDAFFVKDNGAGFDMKYAEKLFVPFQRLHSVEEFEGTGIGLATVRRVITRHGGQIKAESSPGKGATFTFFLSKA